MMKRVKLQEREHTIVVSDYEVAQIEAGLMLLRTTLAETNVTFEMPVELDNLGEIEDEDISRFLDDIVDLGVY